MTKREDVGITISAIVAAIAVMFLCIFIVSMNAIDSLTRDRNELIQLITIMTPEQRNTDLVQGKIIIINKRIGSWKAQNKSMFGFLVPNEIDDLGYIKTAKLKEVERARKEKKETNPKPKQNKGRRKGVEQE